jgi:hypothetical protein
MTEAWIKGLLPLEGMTILFKVYGVTFQGWRAGEKYMAMTEDTEDVFFTEQDIDSWQYADLPDNGEVIIWREQ